MEKKFSKYYTEKSFWAKIGNYSKQAGEKVVYAVLLLYYVLNDENTSLKSKLFITASLGYFILPTDAIIDLTPIIGYSDDLGVLLFALTQIASSITPGIKEKARNKMKDWFSKVDENQLTELENSLL